MKWWYVQYLNPNIYLNQGWGFPPARVQRLKMPKLWPKGWKVVRISTPKQIPSSSSVSDHPPTCGVFCNLLKDQIPLVHDQACTVTTQDVALETKHSWMYYYNGCDTYGVVMGNGYICYYWCYAYIVFPNNLMNPWVGFDCTVKIDIVPFLNWKSYSHHT